MEDTFIKIGKGEN
jgi:hypothetical protein